MTKTNTFRLAEDQLNLLDSGLVVKNGGEFGIRATFIVPKQFIPTTGSSHVIFILTQ